MSVLLAREVLSAYGKVHPSMYPHLEWRLSKENCEALADGLRAHAFDSGEPLFVDGRQLTMFGIPVKIVESDEILLVVKV